MTPDREAPTGERGPMNAIPPTALPSAAGPTIPPGPLTLLWVREGTALAGLFPRKLPTKLRKRVPRLMIEGSLAAALSLVFASGAEASQAAMIAIFLTPAALVQRFDGLLEENRELIWQGDSGGVNRVTAVSVLSLFVGVLAVYAAAVSFLPNTRIDKATAVVAQLARIGEDTILTRRFGSFLPLLAYNAGVLVTLSIVSAVYRSLGALLVLSWNAARWATALSMLIRRAAAATTISKVLFVGVAWAAILPHLLLEAAAYVTGSISAIFFSRALLLYRWDDPQVPSVRRAVGRLYLAAFVLLIMGALSESTFPRLVLSLLG